MPRRLDARTEWSSTRWLSIQISPSYGVSMPPRIFSKVLFPAAFSPTTATISPDAIEKSTCCKARVPVTLLLIPRNSMSGRDIAVGGFCLPSTDDKALAPISLQFIEQLQPLGDIALHLVKIVFSNHVRVDKNNLIGGQLDFLTAVQLCECLDRLVTEFEGLLRHTGNFLALGDGPARFHRFVRAH